MSSSTSTNLTQRSESMGGSIGGSNNCVMVELGGEVNPPSNYTIRTTFLNNIKVCYENKDFDKVKVLLGSPGSLIKGVIDYEEFKMFIRLLCLDEQYDILWYLISNINFDINSSCIYVEQSPGDYDDYNVDYNNDHNVDQNKDYKVNIREYVPPEYGKHDLSILQFAVKCHDVTLLKLCLNRSDINIDMAGVIFGILKHMDMVQCVLNHEIYKIVESGSWIATINIMIKKHIIHKDVVKMLRDSGKICSWYE